MRGCGVSIQEGMGFLVRGVVILVDCGIVDVYDVCMMEILSGGYQLLLSGQSRLFADAIES